MRKPDFAYAKTKAQISCAVTAQLISAFVFAIWIVQFQKSRKQIFLHCGSSINEIDKLNAIMETEK